MGVVVMVMVIVIRCLAMVWLLSLRLLLLLSADFVIFVQLNTDKHTHTRGVNEEKLLQFLIGAHNHLDVIPASI